MSHPLVTISIPTYNQEKYIARSIQSALDQDYPNLEINVADDCSTDQTFEVARQFEKTGRVTVFRHEKNIGRVLNYRNLLYQKARGEWVINLDGDDYLTDKEFISRAIKTIARFNSRNLVLYHASFKIKIFGSPDIINKISVTQYLVKGKSYILKRFRSDSFFHLSALYNKNAAISCGFYSFDSLGTDSLSLLKIAALGNVIVDAVTVGVWNVNENSESVRTSFEKREATNQKAFKQLKDFFKSHFSPAEIEKIEKAYDRHKYKSELYEAAENKETKKILKSFFERPHTNLYKIRQLAKIILKKRIRPE